MKLKTYVKHCIMQYPTLYHNALDVYNHLFYLGGNGYDWKNGTLQRIGFKTKTKKECVDAIIDEEIKSCKMCQTGLYPIGSITKHDIESLQIATYKTTFKQLITYIERIEDAEILAEDFTPYKGFKFYPQSKYNKCMQIPDDIQPDWLEGINMINNFRKQHPELEDDLNNETGWQ